MILSFDTERIEPPFSFILFFSPISIVAIMPPLLFTYETNESSTEFPEIVIFFRADAIFSASSAKLFFYYQVLRFVAIPQ